MTHGLLTTAEAAAACRLSIRQFRRLVDLHQLTVIRVPGGNHRYDWRQVHALIDRYGLRPVRVPVDPDVATNTIPVSSPPPVLVDERPACRLCRHTAGHRDAGPCPHCSLWVCADHLAEHLDGIWPPAWPEAS
jgi:hypothetical protein